MIAFIAALLIASLELMYRFVELGQITWTITIINSIVLALLLLLACLVNCGYCFTGLVNPALTQFSFYFLTQIDYDGVNVSIYYSVVVGTTISFFFLVFFNENWLLSTVCYIPGISYFMWKTGKDMLMAGKHQENEIELTLRCVFCIVIYALVAYKVELLNK